MEPQRRFPSGPHQTLQGIRQATYSGWGEILYTYRPRVMHRSTYQLVIAELLLISIRMHKRDALLNGETGRG